MRLKTGAASWPVFELEVVAFIMALKMCNRDQILINSSD